MIFCLVVPTLVPVLGWGEPWYVAILGCICRLVYTVNCTWLVNSAAHLYGTHPYDKRINPTENAVVSVLAVGEGWHNYHHIFPWDYKAAELKYLNLTTLFLDQFARIGWAYDLKSASPDLVARVALRHGDGSHYKHGVEEHLQEVPYDEYLRIARENDDSTGVRDLHNAEDPTRQRGASWTGRERSFATARDDCSRRGPMSDFLSIAAKSTLILKVAAASPVKGE
ncbi:hypothetical protein FOCC_FOCC003757 [Frankliniella occidentalis]|nr:hypothetical protein FOCC_FOCC003757 [Frankliniella occidentalis]